jgi:hypothetical protein
MRNILFAIVMLFGIGAVVSPPAHAIGCLSGGAAGALAGHMAGHGMCIVTVRRLTKDSKGDGRR